MAGLCAPLSTLRQYPHGYLRMTRGRCGLLLLHRDGLAPSTPCRSPGALRSSPGNGHRAGRHVSKVLTGHSRRPSGLNIQENPPASNHVADVRHDATRALSWKLVRENVELVNLRRFGKQVASLCFFHQGRRHLAVEVGIATGRVVERVENGEGGRALLNGKPRDRPRLSVYQGYGGTQKICDLLLLSWLRLQRNVQSNFCHRLLLL